MNEIVLEINSIENKNLDSFFKLKSLNVLYPLKNYLDDLYYNQDVKKDKTLCSPVSFKHSTKHPQRKHI